MLFLTHQLFKVTKSKIENALDTYALKTLNGQTMEELEQGLLIGTWG